MRRGQDEERERQPARPASEGFLVCLDGMPIARATSCDLALAMAEDLLDAASEGDYSVYEVATGIHLDVIRRAYMFLGEDRLV
jgi:hypothetical protein